MPTECSTDCDRFGRVEGRRVAAEFDGGAITSDAGGLCFSGRPIAPSGSTIPPRSTAR